MPVIGFLGALSAFRWAEGNCDRLPDLADELVHRKVDVLVTHGTPGTRAAKQATKTIPIVMAISGDAVATGLVATSRGRPSSALNSMRNSWSSSKKPRLPSLRWLCS